MIVSLQWNIAKFMMRDVIFWHAIYLTAPSLRIAIIDSCLKWFESELVVRIAIDSYLKYIVLGCEAFVHKHSTDINGLAAIGLGINNCCQFEFHNLVTFVATITKVCPLCI